MTAVRSASQSPPRHLAPGRTESVEATPFVSILTGSHLISNGDFSSAATVNGPLTFFGSRHESEHVPLQPYCSVKVFL